MILFELLADAKLNPVAVRLHVSEEASGALLSLVATDPFPTFAARFPCLVESDRARSMPPEVFESSGIQIVSDDLIHKVDGTGKPATTSREKLALW